MQGEVHKSMADASEIQKQLVQAHDAAMKELKDYAVCECARTCVCVCMSVCLSLCVCVCVCVTTGGT